VKFGRVVRWTGKRTDKLTNNRHVDDLALAVLVLAVTIVQKLHAEKTNSEHPDRSGKTLLKQT